MQGLVRGSLRIAGVTTTEYFLAQWLKPFLDAYPGIEVDLVIDNRDAIIRRLEREQDDLAIMMMPPTHLALQSLEVMDNPLCLIGPVGHPWAKRRATPLAKLADTDLLMREVGSGTRQATLDFLAEHKLMPRIVTFAILAGLPFGAAIYLVDNSTMVFLLIGIPAAAGGMYLGPTLGMVQSLVAVRMRTVASALFLFIINLIGMGLGSVVIGGMSDALTPTYGQDALRYTLLIVMVFNFWAAYHYWRAGRFMETDLKRAVEASA